MLPKSNSELVLAGVLRPRPTSRSSYGDDSNCLLEDLITSSFLHDFFVSRYLVMSRLRNDYTVPPR
jgi:hypothetical protein